MGRKRHGSLDWLQQELSQLVKRARRKGKDADILTACGQLLQIEKERSDRASHVQAAPLPPKDVHFVVRYEDSEDRPEIAAERNAAVKAIRQALGNEKLPRSAQRNDLITRICDYFGVARDFAQFVICELEKGKENGEWEAEYVQSNQNLLAESNGAEDAATEPQPGDYDAA